MTTSHAKINDPEDGYGEWGVWVGIERGDDEAQAGDIVDVTSKAGKASKKKLLRMKHETQRDGKTLQLWYAEDAEPRKPQAQSSTVHVNRPDAKAPSRPSPKPFGKTQQSEDDYPF